ncbi:MAG TPA: ABC transporter ATP-binding protein [Stellaceae bacterium]|nr:ABC transporter ATP-binding protein [Stellaceae bacterium]
MSDRPVLEARALHKAFGALEVTRSVSLALARGARHAVVGPNGSGKTTLFNLLAGEVRPDRGQVLIDGTDVTRKPPNVRARAGLARSFQKNNLFPNLSVRENIAIALTIGERRSGIFWRRFDRLPDLEERIVALARRVRVEAMLDHEVRALPYGTQRQVEVGLALAIAPKILLLDEPTAGMSAEETREMTALVASLPGDIAILIVEHDMDVVFEIAERITVLDYGSVLIEGTRDEVRRSDVVRRRYFGERVA